MKPEKNVCHILVLSYSTLHTADAVGAWNKVRTELTPFDHLAVHHYPLDDGDTDFLVLLDLLDFVRHKFFSFLLLAPTAASWSRARHANSATRCLRSRSHPLGCSELSTNHSRLQQQLSRHVVVCGTGRLAACSFLIYLPGRFRRPPASPWSLVEFQRLSGFNDIWRGAAFMCRFADMEQRHPTGMLSNIQGLRRSTYPGWPSFKDVNYNLQYTGLLPKVCPCSVVHKDSTNDTGGSFLASSSFSLSFSL